MSAYDDFEKAATAAAETAYSEWKRLLDERDKIFDACKDAADNLIDIETEIRMQSLHENVNTVSDDLRSREDLLRAKFEQSNVDSYYARAKAEKAADFYNKMSAAANVVKIMLKRE